MIGRCPWLVLSVSVCTVLLNSYAGIYHSDFVVFTYVKKIYVQLNVTSFTLTYNETALKMSFKKLKRGNRTVTSPAAAPPITVVSSVVWGTAWAEPMELHRQQTSTRWQSEAH